MLPKYLTAFFLLFSMHLHAISLDITNETGLSMWMQFETSSNCLNNNPVFSKQGALINDKATIKVPLDTQCLPKNIKLYTQNPVTNPGTPISISLYGQALSGTTDISFAIQKIQTGRFALKKIAKRTVMQ